MLRRLSLMLLLAGCVSEYEEPTVSDRSLGLGRPDAVVLINSTNVPVRFELTGEYSEPSRYALMPNEARQFTDRRSRRYYLDISTSGREEPLRFALVGARRYEIYWNYERKMWMMRELSARR